MAVQVYNIVVEVAGEYSSEYGATPGIVYAVGTVLNIINLDTTIMTEPLPTGLSLQLNSWYTQQLPNNNIQNTPTITPSAATVYGTTAMAGVPTGTLSVSNNLTTTNIPPTSPVSSGTVTGTT